MLLILVAYLLDFNTPLQIDVVTVVNVHLPPDSQSTIV